MAINNRTNDNSEQRFTIQHYWAALSTGATVIAAQIPYPCVLETAFLAAYGVSNALTTQLNLNRFIPGAGFTNIILATGSSNLPSTYGTSGYGSLGRSGMVMPWGSTLMQLMSGDILTIQLGGTTTAVTGLAVTLVVRPVQDVKVHFGMNL